RDRAQDVEGARPARGQPHRRLRRRDRGDDRRRGVRGPRRAGEADRGARHAGAIRAGAREGVHPAGRGRRAGTQRAGGVLGGAMSTGTQTEVIMPQMGVSVSEGTITKWLKSEGERIERDESLLEISTDKVDTEVPSPAEGIVSQILVQEGETVEVGTVLALLAPAGAALAPAEAAPAAPAAVPEAPPVVAPEP